MVIGGGLLAKAFLEHYSANPDITVFASGVANSQERDMAAFEREQELLLAALATDNKLVYFSTCSVYDPQLTNSPYVQHKLRMEQLVLAAGENTVFRLPQVVGHTPNGNTLTNYIYQRIKSGEHFEIWKNAQRNIIDVTHVALIAKEIISSEAHTTSTINIAAAKSVSMAKIVEIFEKITKKKANCSPIDCGGSYDIDTSFCEEIARSIDIQFNDAYPENVLQKYYGQ